jgi:hypothetical protein
VIDLKTKLTKLASTTLHGRYPQQINQPGIDKKATHIWLRRSDAFPETEGYTFAIQDEVIPTRSCLNYIMKDSNVVTDTRHLAALHRQLSNM